ncbi:MAG: hypothetical protein M1608_17470 [Candidatus Omnitrophica bacterium]|nr:hypothetical protein [Candidatus Omnitrophota bacterium]
MKNPTQTELLAQIAQIQLMERGTLSPYTFKDRAPQPTPYYKLQRWEKGKNVPRHIQPEQVPLLEEALKAYARFQDLVEQYAQLIIAQSREQLASQGVKKKPGRRPHSSWPKSTKSSN